MGNKTMVDRHFNVQQSAEALYVDDEQVLAWIHSGELVAVNVAKSANGKKPRWRISESELGRFLLRRRNPAAAKQPAPAKPAKRQPVKQYV